MLHTAVIPHSYRVGRPVKPKMDIGVLHMSVKLFKYRGAFSTTEVLYVFSEALVAEGCFPWEGLLRNSHLNANLRQRHSERFRPRV